MTRLLNQSFRQLARLFTGLVCLLAFTQGPASAAEDFYKGKTITINVSGSGSYEAYARMLAQHMPKYIPGQPNIIVKNMSGASGLKATNYIYNNAAKDGTELAGVHGQIPLQPLFTTQGVHYDPAKLSWIGSVTKELYIAYMWHTSPVQSMEEARVKESTVGGQALGSMSIDIAVLANAMMGTKFKIVTGYSGSAETRLAVERGEINGHVGTAYTTILSSDPDWIPEKKITIIAQFGTKRHKDLQDVPLLLDYVIDPENRKAMELFLARQETGKPYFAPPGVPADRLAILRKAFEAAIKDPGFLADAAKAKYDVVEPMTGPDMEKFVAEMSKIPPSYAKRINDTFAKYSANK